MDPQQHRLAIEFALDKRRYVYKSGETDPRGEEGTSIVETTQALGCVISVENAVLVKRNIGFIWADTETTPYTEIFNDVIDSAYVWRAVTIMRTVDSELYSLKSSGVDRAEAVSVHLDRVILYLVHQDPTVQTLHFDTKNYLDIVNTVRAAVRPIYLKVAEYLQTNHPTDYLAVFCKNTPKCVELAKFVRREARPIVLAKHPDLFTDFDALDEK